MRLFNKGKRHIQHKESRTASGLLIPGAQALPGKVFTVSDKVGLQLRKAYPKELESLDDVSAKFSDPKAASTVPAVAASPAADQQPVGIPMAPAADDFEGSLTPAGDSLDPPATQAEKEEADSFNVTVKDLREYKESLKTGTE